MYTPNTGFTPAVAKNLKCYVYLLIDPRTSCVFYVGRGTGNRISIHLHAALSRPSEADRLETIRAIRREGLEPLHVILRHGLTAKEAQEVEAAIIDYIYLPEPTSAVHGYSAYERGMMTISEAITCYDAPDAMVRSLSLA